MSLMGIHVADINDIIDPQNKNINFFQFFVQPTNDYKNPKYNDIYHFIKKNKIYLIVHASYSINLARRWKETDWMVQQFIAEIRIADQLGCFGVVIHTGKQLELSKSEALNNMYTSLLYVHESTKECQKVRIIIETPSGQGTETLTKIEDFCNFMNKFYQHPDKLIQDRFGVCIDTCHVFASGHPIHTQTGMNDFFSTIDRIIGIDRIKLCHLNDSKKSKGSKIDRHANIGSGMIPKKQLLKIVGFMKNLEIPIVLETPYDGIYADHRLLLQTV
jgi:deoxyribonuclease-4